MQSRTNSKWLHRVFVFLLAIMVVGSYAMPQSFGMFGAETAKAAAKDLPGGGTIQLLGTDDNHTELTDMDGQTAEFSMNGRNKRYKFKVMLNDLSASEGDKVRVEIADGLAMVLANESELNNQVVENGITKEKFEEIEAVYGGPRTSGESIALTKTYIYQKADTDRGTRAVEFEFKSSVTDAVIEFEVGTDQRLLYKEITDGVKVSYLGANETTTLKMDANCSTPLSGKASDTFSRAVSNPCKIEAINHALNFMSADFVGGTNAHGEKITSHREVTIKCEEFVEAELMTDEFSGLADVFELTKTNTGYLLKTKIPTVSRGIASFYMPIRWKVNFPADRTGTRVVLNDTLELLNGEVKEGLTRTVTLYNSLRTREEGEDVFVNYGSIEAYLNGALKPKNNTYSLNITGYPTVTTNVNWLGSFILGNAGESDSAPKRVVMKFDENKAHVRAVGLMIPEGNKVNTFSIKTNKRTKTVHVTKKGDDGTEEYSFERDNHINADELGLASDEYIINIAYEIGVIPADSNIVGKIYGDIPYDFETISREKIGTIECTNSLDASVTTGEGESLITYTGKSAMEGPYFFRYITKNPEIVAGENLQIGEPFSPTESIYDVNEASEGKSFIGFENLGDDYNVYICVPENASISNVRVLIGEDMKYIDVTKQVKGTDRLIRGEKKNYYKLDFSAIPREYRAIQRYAFNPEGGIRYTRAILHYQLNTTKTTPPGEYMTSDNIFVECKNIDENEDEWVTRTAISTPNEFNLNTDGGMLFKLNRTDSKYIIHALTDVVAETEAKTGLMENYVKYLESDPQTILPIGGSEKVELKTTVRNQSGVSAEPGTTVWQPIPKKGEDWADLTKGSKDKDGNEITAAPYNLELEKKITNPNPSTWKLYYAVSAQVPEKNAQGKVQWRAWDQDTSKVTWIPEDQMTENDPRLADVNCIKMVAENALPADLDDNLKFDVKATSEDNSEKNSVMVIRPVVYRNLTVNAGTPDEKVISDTAPGDATALLFATGKIKGTVFDDLNRNGKWDKSESAADLTGDGTYKVELWGGAEGAKQLVAESTVDPSSGIYKFNGLATGDEYQGYYQVRITNRDKKGKDFRGVNDGELLSDQMVVTEKFHKAETGKTKDNAFTHNTDPSTDVFKGYAFSDPITAIDAEDFNYSLALGGTYNCGVYWDDPTTLTFKVDGSKGSLVPEENGEWVDVIKNTPTELIYEGAACDNVAWPKVEPGEGYEFKGWVPESDPDAEPIKDPKGATFGYEDVPYVAVFETAQYPASFDTNGGKPGSIDNVSIPYGSEILGNENFPDDPTKEGNVFRGWQATEDTGNIERGAYITPDDTMPATEEGKSLGLKAIYEPGNADDGKSDEVTMAAGDILVTPEEAKELTADKVIEASGAKAWMKDDPSKNVPIDEVKSGGKDIAKSDLAKGAEGDYEVVITSEKPAKGKAESVTLTASVRDKKDVDDNGNGFGANDFTYPTKKDDGTPNDPLTGDDVKKLADVVTTGDTDPDDVTVNPDDLKALNDAVKDGTPGDYPVKLTDKDGNEVEVTVTLEGPLTASLDTNGGKPGKIEDVLIDAGEPILKSDKFPTGDKAPTKDGSELRGWEVTEDAGDLKAGDIIGDDTKMPEEPVKLKAVWEDNTGTDKDGNPSEVKGNSDGIGMAANDFIITPEEADSLTPAQAITNSGAKAWEKADPSKDVPMDPDATKVKNNGDGTVTVKLVTEPLDGETASKEVTAKVKDHKAVDDNGTNGFGANDFTYPTVDDEGNPSKPLTEDDVKKLADVVTIGGTDIDDVTVDPDDLKKLNDAVKDGKTGDYPVKIKDNDGNETTVTVTIADGRKDVKVSFRAGEGGTTSQAAVTVKSGSAVGVTPASKANDGYIASGLWQSSEGGRFSAGEVAKYVLSGKNAEVTFTALFDKDARVTNNTTNITNNNGGGSGNAEDPRKVLEGKIATAEKVNQDNYTPETAKKLQDAIDAGKKALADPNATDEQLKTAGDALDNAIKALVKKTEISDVKPVDVRINFAAEAGGTTSQASVTVKSGNAINVTPVATANAGYVYSGNWQCSQGGTFTATEIKNFVPSGKSAVVTFTAQFAKNPSDPANITNITNIMNQSPIGVDNKVVDKAIQKLNSDGDVKGTTFGKLKLRGWSKGKKAVLLRWTKTKGATKYVLYGNQCNVKGKKFYYKKLKTFKSGTLKYIPKKVLKAKIKKGTYYKFMMTALDKNGKVIAVSKTVHVTTAGGKKGNDKSVKRVSPKNGKVTLKVKKSRKLKVKEVTGKLKVARHRVVSWETSNSKIATVKKGKVTAKKKGTCTIWAYAQNGVYTSFKITVK